MNREDLGKVANALDLPVDVVIKTYKAYWKYIKNTIEALPLKDNLSEKEFNELRTCFNIPSLGKLSCTYEKYNKVKNRFKYLNKIRNNGTEDN